MRPSVPALPGALLAALLLSSTLCTTACESDGGGEEAVACEGTICDERCGPCEAVVARVVDGDTIELADGRKVRYLYVDTPETVKPGEPIGCYGPEASAYNKALVDQKNVRLEYDFDNSGCTDFAGRTLAYVWVDGVWVNEDLARRGYAPKWDGEATYACEAQLDAAIADAKAKGRGGWEECDW